MTMIIIQHTNLPDKSHFFLNYHGFSLSLTGSTSSAAMEALADDIIPINTNTTRYPPSLLPNGVVAALLKV